MTFSEKLKLLREREKLTQEQLVQKLIKKSKGLHITRDQLTNWEQGRNFPRQEVMLVLTKYFNTTLDDLFNPNISIKTLLSRMKAQPQPAQRQSIST